MLSRNDGTLNTILLYMKKMNPTLEQDKISSKKFWNSIITNRLLIFVILIWVRFISVVQMYRDFF